MPYHFYNTIFHLRQHEEIILYDKVLELLPADEQLVKEFLQIEYEAEVMNYPFTAPGFNAAAALWAAKTTYTFCELILYRDKKAEELPALLPPYAGDMDAGAILSADLCLRFLPGLLVDTRHIDPEDPLYALAEDILQLWHYSGIGYPLKNERVDMALIFGNNCLQQLYTDRVIEKKDMPKAMMPGMEEKIKAALGMHKTLFWKELNLTNNNE